MRKGNDNVRRQLIVVSTGNGNSAATVLIELGLCGWSDGNALAQKVHQGVLGRRCGMCHCRRLAGSGAYSRVSGTNEIVQAASALQGGAAGVHVLSRTEP